MLADDVVKIATPQVDWLALAPVMTMIAGAVVILIWASMTRKGSRSSLFAILTVLTAAVSIGFAIPLWRDVTDAHHGPYTAIAGAISVDGFTAFFMVLVALAVMLAALLADGYLRREDLDST